MSLFKFTLLSFLIVFLPQSVAQNDTEPPKPGRRITVPLRVGDVNIVQARAIHSSAIALDDQGTVHLLSVMENGENHLLRISRKGMVKQLVMYRGWPYVLDKRNRIYAFDTSLSTAFKNKIPYIALRSIKTLPLALGSGAGLFAIALVDQALTGIITSTNFKPSEGFLAGVVIFYGIDMTRTLFFMSPRDLNQGGNYFKKLVATGVSKIQEDDEAQDFKVTIRHWRGPDTTANLSQLRPSYTVSGSCAEYLTRMNMK